MNNRSYFSMWMLTLAFCIVAASAFAQSNVGNSAKPRVSFSVVPGHSASLPEKENSRLSADETGATIFLRERAFSLFRRDSAFQLGTIFIVRSGSTTTDALVVGYALEYEDSLRNPLPNFGSPILSLPAPLPPGALTVLSLPQQMFVAINGLQGDLTPTAANIDGLVTPVNAASRLAPNFTIIQPGQTSVALNFTSRWSDQSYIPRSAGLQGRRFARLTILQLNEITYTLGITLATVVLDDPQNVAPILVNAIQNKQQLRNTSDLIELETLGLRSDGFTNAVFYDDNYNVLQYTATSSDTSIITATAFQSDPRVGGRPSLLCTVLPNAPTGSVAAITITANDGTGQLAGNIFTIQVVNTVSSIENILQLPFQLSPNPMVDLITIEAIGQHSGEIRIRVLNALGIEVLADHYTVSAGATYRYSVNISSLPSGMYVLEVQDGVERRIGKVIKQ
jgi:hypothetical protein